MSRLFLFCQLLSCSSWFSAQKWLGQWTASTSCDRTTCCCVQSAKVSLSAQNLVAEGPIAGQCDSATTIRLTAAVPSGMSWVALFGGTVFEVTISGDYSTMTVVNTVDRQCSGELYSGSGCNSSSTYILSMTCDFFGFFLFCFTGPAPGPDPTPSPSSPSTFPLVPVVAGGAGGLLVLGLVTWLCCR